MASGTQPQQIDGRTARAIRTRDAIVDACIALVHEGDPRPTAPRIAERAGVSVRSVFQHFDDLEHLYTRVAERFTDRVARLFGPIDATLPYEARLQAFLDQRVEVLEEITPIRRAANVHAPFSPALSQRLGWGHELLRLQLDTVFRNELDAAPADERDRVLDLLDVLASWPNWEHLRTSVGCDPGQARALVERLLRLVLDPLAAAPGVAGATSTST